MALAAGCTKSPPYVITDPATGLPPVALTTASGDCLITKITQKNKSANSADNAFEIKRDAALVASNISFYDSLANKSEYNIQLVTAGDTIRLSAGGYFILNSTTKLVSYFYTLADNTDPTSDKQVYQYLYDANGYLVKKYLFVNGASSPYYETNYTYNNNLLSACVVYAGAQKVKLLESSIDYDMTAARKAWIYLFPDFFEGYQYLQALNFGKRGNYPVKNIVTKIYDVSDGSILDTWATTFNGYVYSQDNFILQTTAQGDLQQGLGLLFGTTRFDYQCTK